MIELELVFVKEGIFYSQVIIACAKGGTSIEDLAEKYPDMIIKVHTVPLYLC